VGAANALHQVASTPEYGQGEGGWRLALAQEGGDRAERGPAVPGQELFLDWLVRRAVETAPAVVVDQLVELFPP
jgi:hypothetical protein